MCEMRRDVPFSRRHANRIVTINQTHNSVDAIVTANSRLTNGQDVLLAQGISLSQ